MSLNQYIKIAIAVCKNKLLPDRYACSYSNLGEEELIKKYLDMLPVQDRYCIDIAAGDGLMMSNTYFLYRKGWRGLAVEFHPGRFASLARNFTAFENVNLSKCMVTPENVISLFAANSVNKHFGFLNLDIDGYDHYVLHEILRQYRPMLICAEINEKIPPPVKFTVKWDPAYTWSQDHFYGQSISQLHTLCETFQYAIVELHYNNAFLVPLEVNPGRSLSPEEAYRSGYLDKKDRQKKFPWNKSMEPLLHMNPIDACAFIETLFSKHKGQFILHP